MKVPAIKKIAFKNKITDYLSWLINEVEKVNKSKVKYSGSSSTIKADYFLERTEPINVTQKY